MKDMRKPKVNELNFKKKERKNKQCNFYTRQPKNQKLTMNIIRVELKVVMRTNF